MGNFRVVDTEKTLVVLAFGLLAAGLSLLFSPQALAFNANATPKMINRTVIALGDPGKVENIFYDKDTSNDNYIWQNYSGGCYSDIELTTIPASNGSRGGYKGFILRYSTKLSNGECSTERTKTYATSEVTSYPDNEWVVFYRDNKDEINSVKADVTNTFINTKLGAKDEATAIYIEKDDMDPYACPSLIIDQKSPDGWMYVMMRKSNNPEANGSKQYAALMRDLASKRFFPNVTDEEIGLQFSDDAPMCEVIPADGDDQRNDVLAYYGLPDSYYNTRAGDENREQVDLGYSGAKLGGFDLHSMRGVEAAGMALVGPLKGGFMATGELSSDGGKGGGEGADSPTCAAKEWGWIMCPVINLAGYASEEVSKFIEGYLVTPALSLTGGPLRDGWGKMVGIANGILVVAFLVVVLSQATSYNLSAYGVKRMMPRLIAAAILINLSYFICAILVDVSNILGANITSIIFSASASVGGVGANLGNGGFFSDIGQVGGLIVGGGVAAGAVVLAGIFIVPILLAMLSVVLILAARTAIITLLILIAPLAFAAWVLPNTEKYFKKWWDIFLQMLLVYPAVMALFAASSVAASMVSATGDLTAMLVALLIQALPLLALPALIKMTSGVLGKIDSQLKSNASRTKGKYDNSGFGKYRAQKKASLRQQELAGTISNKGLTGRARAARGRASRAIYGKMPGGYGSSIIDNAMQQREQLTERASTYASRNPELARAMLRYSEHGDAAKAAREQGLDASATQTLQQLARQGVISPGISAARVATSGLAQGGKLTKDDVARAESVIDKANLTNTERQQQLGQMASDIVGGASKSGMVQHGNWGIDSSTGRLSQGALAGPGASHQKAIGDDLKKKSFMDLSYNALRQGTGGRESFDSLMKADSAYRASAITALGDGRVNEKVKDEIRASLAHLEFNGVATGSGIAAAERAGDNAHYKGAPNLPI